MYPQTDLFGRLARIVDATGGAALPLMAVMMLVLVLLVILNKRMALVFLYWVALMFSGHANETLDSGSTLFRWLIVVLLSGTIVFGVAKPGLPATMLGLCGLLGLVTSFYSPVFFFGLQRATLLGMSAVVMMGAIAHSIQSTKDVRTFYKLCLVAAGVYVLLGMASLGSLREGMRFAGAAGRKASLFGLTGGILLPIALWAVLNPRMKTWRWYGAAVLALIAMLLVLSTQRTGTFMGLIACTPLLARFRLRRLLMGLLAAGLVGFVLWMALQAFPKQAEYVHERFGTLDPTGRTLRWKAALDVCLERPYLGHGMGSSGVTGVSFHNAYLVAWNDVGIGGLALFGGAILMMVFQSLRLLRRQKGEETQMLGRLALGISLGCLAGAFFEEGLFSPSNIVVFSALSSSVINTRLLHLNLSTEEEDELDGEYGYASSDGTYWPGYQEEPG